MNDPRILTLAGTAHPKALVQRIEPATGLLLFAWLDADGNRVDSGNSVARFTPLDPMPPAPDAQPGDAPAYPEVDDAVLIAAIENPPPVVPAVPQEVTRRQLLLALYAAGITRGQIKQMLQGNEPALIEYEEALTFKRDHPLIVSMGAALGKTAEEIDQLFIAAAGI